MSNAMALSAVTATLTTIVQTAVDDLDIVPRPVVAAGDLDESGDNNRVFVHLLRVSRNQQLATADLPTRSHDGDLRARPCVALDLHYLVAFRGSSEHETQLMLARTAAVLHSSPVLTRAWLEAAVSEHTEIAGHDLADAERVRLTPEPMNVDELTRIWALYSQGSFVPTLAVIAGPVLVETEQAPSFPLPVRAVGIGVRPFRGLRVDSVAGPGGPGAPIRAASPMPDLTVVGAGFMPGEDETIEVRVDDAAVGHDLVDDTTLVLPAAAVQPGRHVLRVHRVAPAADPALSATERVTTSEHVVLVVTPELDSATASTGPGTSSGLRSGTVAVSMTPPLEPDARTRLLLDSTTLDPPVSLVLPPDLPSGSGPFPTVDYVVEDAPAGTYRVTLEVDGARSIPPVDGSGHYVLTTVTL